jgi:hypothetical protein
MSVATAVLFAIGFGCLVSGAVIAVCMAMLLPGKPKPEPFYGDVITTDPDAGREGRRHG